MDVFSYDNTQKKILKKKSLYSHTINEIVILVS